jgi:hypothetical protein
MSCRRALSLVTLASLAVPSGLVSVAMADTPSAAAVADAGKHFQRGVMMYNEADYRAALVEFKRAYEIAPNPAVLYNIGQTHYQLQNYAAALTALGRYLTEAGSSAQHRREVEQTIDTLQTRVGKIAISASQPGVDITVDDEAIGKAPVSDPVLVSIGRRKVVAIRDGRVVDSKLVDVAAGDTVSVMLSVADTPNRAPSESSSKGSVLTPTVGWIITGSLGAIAIGTGIAAFSESRSLKTAREQAGVSHDTLNSKSHLVTGLSIVADISGVLALITGGITLRYTLAEGSGGREAHLSVSPNSLQVAGKF